MLASGYLLALLMAWTTVVAMFSDSGGQLRRPLLFRVAPFALVIIGTLVVRVLRRTAGFCPAACLRHHSGFVLDVRKALFQPRGSGPVRGTANGIGLYAESGKSVVVAGRDCVPDCDIGSVDPGAVVASNDCGAVTIDDVAARPVGGGAVIRDSVFRRAPASVEATVRLFADRTAESSE